MSVTPEDRAASGLKGADAAEVRGKHEAKAKAAKAASATRAAADKRAAGHSATVEQRKQRVESSAEAKKKAAQREAKAELDEADKGKQSAAEAAPTPIVSESSLRPRSKSASRTERADRLLRAGGRPAPARRSSVGPLHPICEPYD